MIDPGSMAPDAHPPDPITITDRPLGEALSVFASLDPRYSWREIDGVIEIRPYDAWRDPKDPLNRPLPRVVVDNRPTSEVIGLIGRLLGRPFVSDAERDEHVAMIKRSLPKLREIPPAPRYTLMFTIPGRTGMGFDIQ
jgi:hypothetical protein